MYRVQRYSKFFGPGVYAEVSKVDAEKRIVALKLTTTTKGEPVPASPTPVPDAAGSVGGDEAKQEF